jgi:phage shock protein PspC (stress-responsive transcriptional regulator)
MTDEKNPSTPEERTDAAPDEPTTSAHEPMTPAPEEQAMDENTKDEAPDDGAPDEGAEASADADDTSPPPPPPSTPPPADPPPPPPDHAYVAPRIRLTRREENKVIAGVCSGLAAYTGTDPVLWRVGAVVFALLGFGIAIPAYIVAWLVMPVARPGEPVAPMRDVGEMNAGRWVAIAVIGVGALVLFDNVFNIRGGILFGLVLVGVGIAFWGRDWGSDRPPPRPPVPPAAPPPPPGTLSAHHAAGPSNAPTTPMPTMGSAPTAPLPAAAPPYGTPPTPPPAVRGAAASPVPPSPRRPKESSFLGRLVIGAAALAVATGLIIENIWIDIPAKVYVAILLGIVGLGLLIGAWLGRARWLVWVGVGLTICLMSVSWVPTDGPVGDVAWNPTSMLQLNDEEPYRIAAGEAVLDLTEVDFTSDRAIDVRVGFGQLEVIVPREVDAEIVARVQGGEMDVFGQHDEGWDVRQTVFDAGSGDGSTVRVEARVTFGEIRVRREGASDRRTFEFEDNDNRFDFDFNTPEFNPPRLGER